MQRHCKFYQKSVIALAMVVLTFAVAVVSTFAIKPPTPTGVTGYYTSTANLTETDADAVYRMVNEMYQLGYFQFGDFVLVGRRGSTVRLLACPSGYTFANGGTTISVTNPANLQMQEYNFVDGGFRLHVALSVTTSYPLENVLCYIENGVLVRNSNYVYGTATSSQVIATSNEWHEYYEKVYFYDDNIADAEAQGRADGYEDGYSAGYEIGEEDGYNSGYAAGQEYGEEIGYGEGYQEGYEGGVYAGYADGYETGLAEGNANAEKRYQQGVIAGQQAGYSQGYTEGQSIGYETGYTEGRDYAYPIAYQEGYNDGYEEGLASGEGGDTIITENLDIGSIISAIPHGAKNIINGAFGFEIFGINVAGTLTAILVVAIVGFVIKWLLSLKS